MPSQSINILDILVEKPLLHFPVKTGAKGRRVTISADGVTVRSFDIELAGADIEWWASLDVNGWIGKTLRIAVDLLPEGMTQFPVLLQTDTPMEGDNLYREALRPQIHFSAQRGWINDPNGLVFYKGEYHLFFQHNPYGWNWGNMHWGHAVSPDLVHWTELGETLYPDEHGTMFSGSAVVDWNNTSGFGRNGVAPLVLIYTAAGDPTTQCIAYSNDGRSFVKYEGNPVVPQFTGGNRDPKVFWHEPTLQWVMSLYVEIAGGIHSIHFLTSPNLREWTLVSVTEGGTGADRFLYECPDFFELPVEGNPLIKKWVLNAANSEYALGSFDGGAFTPETAKLPDVRGKGFYAAQTFSDMPDGRRIQIGWLQAPSPGMPFNQAQSLPCELTLRNSAEGLQIRRTPIPELDSLRDGADQSDNLENFRAELIELRAEFEPGESEIVTFQLRDATISYEAETQEIIVNGHRSSAPLIDAKQRLIIYMDRTVLEVFASDGLTYVPLPFIPDPNERSVAVHTSGDVRMIALEVYPLKSLWNAGK